MTIPNYPVRSDQTGLIAGNDFGGVENPPKHELTLREKMVSPLSPDNFKDYAGVLPIIQKALDSVSGYIVLGGFYKQLCVYNPTPNDVYLSNDSGIVDATHYKFHIKPTTMWVSMPLNFNGLYFFQTGIVAGTALTPLIFAYIQDNISPGSYAI